MTCGDLEWWVKTANGAATPIIAAAVAFIAWMNWRTAELKRQQDLFDKRFDFYLRMKKLYEALVFDREERFEPDYDDIDRWYTEAKFLFGKELADHVGSIPDYVTEHPNFHNLSWFNKPFDRYLMLR